MSRKIPKALSGIETNDQPSKDKAGNAGKYLKPYQGLKQWRLSTLQLRVNAGKYLKPYQGLKPKDSPFASPSYRPENT